MSPAEAGDRAGREIPEGFQPLPPTGGFIVKNSPLYYKREADGGYVFGAPVTEDHCNMGMICHGGWLATLFDMVMPLSVKLRDDDLGSHWARTSC